MSNKNSYIPAVLGALTVLFIVFNSIVGWKLQFLPGDLGDGRLNNYFLEHGYLFFTGKLDSYWSAGFMFPQPNVITFSDNLLGSLPAYMAFRLMDIPKENAYQFWLISMYLLNYISSYFAIRKLEYSTTASAVGAFIFTCGLPTFISVVHVQLLPRFFLPWIAVLLFLGLKNRNTKYLFISLWFAVFQLYCGVYLGFFAIFSALATLIYFLIHDRKSFVVFLDVFNKSTLWKTGIHLIGSGVLLAVLFIPYIRTSKEFGYPPMWEIHHYMPRLWGYIITSNVYMIYKPINNFLKEYVIFENVDEEHLIGIGFVSLILLFYYLRKYKNLKPNIQFAVFSFFFLLLITVQIRNIEIYGLISDVIPGTKSLRALGRISLLMLFYVAIVVATYTDQLKEKITTHKFNFLLFVFISILFLETWSNAHRRFRLEKAVKRENEIIALINTSLDKSKTLVVLNNSTTEIDIIFHHIDVMFAAQTLGIKTVNGYTGKYPWTYQPFFHKPNQENLDHWINNNVYLKNKDQFNIISRNNELN